MQYSFISFPKRNAVLLPIKCGRLMVGNPYENILLTWQAWQATSRQQAGGQPKMQQSNSCWIRIQTANIFNLLVIQGYQFLIATNVVFNGSLTLAASSCMMPSQVTTPHPHPHTYILQVWIYTHGKWSYIKVHGPVKSNQPFNVFVHQEQRHSAPWLQKLIGDWFSGHSEAKKLGEHRGAELKWNQCESTIRLFDLFTCSWWTCYIFINMTDLRR